MKEILKALEETTETVILGIVVICLTIVDINLYNYNQKQKEFINKVTPLIEQCDTTHSIRNYEVLTDSINNLFLKWHCNDTSNE